MNNQIGDSHKEIAALIYCKFLDIGPEAVAWYPDLERKARSAVALKSINLFAAEGGKVPENISVIPFSSFSVIGIVKCIEVPDPGARGKARDATLTILVDENYNNLVLRYIDDLDKLLTHVSGRILVNEQVKADVDDLRKVVIESYTYITENMDIFQALEHDREKFLDEPKIKHLKATISEIENLIEDYIKDVDQFGADEVKDALKLAWEIKQIDLYNLSPEDIRHIVDLANTLKLKKETIVIQKHKLQQYKNQMTPEALHKLNQQIDQISINLEKFIEQLLEIVEKLTKRSEKVIKSHKTKKGIEFIFRKQFEKLRINLKQHFNLFREIERLPPDKFQQVKEIYIHLDEMRKLRRNRDVGKAADEMAKILGIDRNMLLEYTRDSKMKEDFNRIFQIES
ncbi:MAG: hypothetical protein HWN66_09640 [Candidatus Helarchaeota archaeon]|nr:hypothetical protein [Candidatus Helarchaeota archaeon]